MQNKATGNKRLCCLIWQPADKWESRVWPSVETWPGEGTNNQCRVLSGCDRAEIKVLHELDRSGSPEVRITSGTKLTRQTATKPSGHSAGEHQSPLCDFHQSLSRMEERGGGKVVGPLRHICKCHACQIAGGCVFLRRSIFLAAERSSERKWQLSPSRFFSFSSHTICWSHLARRKCF